MKLKLPLSLLVSLLLLVSCASKKEELKSDDIAESFKLGTSYLEKENYLKAEELFTFIIYNDPGGPFADDAQFYLAESFYAREEYLTAISEYDRIIRRMKKSEYLERAYWRKAEAFCELSPDYRLERDMTDKALKYLHEFLEIFPSSGHVEDARTRIGEMRSKLAKKMLSTAQLYDTLHEYESASYYYDSLLDEFADTPERLPALIGKTYGLVQLERWDEAQIALNNLESVDLSSLSETQKMKLQKIRTDISEQALTQP